MSVCGPFVPESITGTPVYESWFVPRNKVMFGHDLGRSAVFMHPYSLLILRWNGRLPLETRHTEGHLEQQRVRRQRTRQTRRGGVLRYSGGRVL